MKDDHNFKKKFGQNFILDFNVIFTTLDLLQLNVHDKVLEIGPGDGRFTDVIIDQVEHLDLVEVDIELADYLAFKYEAYDNLTIHNMDILEYELTEYKDHSYKVFGALPYNISKPIISKFLESDIRPSKMVFITQYEVAEDYAAEAPKATFLSNYAHVFADVELKAKIDKHLFHPQPKVHGGVLEITPRKRPLVDDPERFTKFLKNGFRTPRKKLLNTLSSIYKDINWEDAMKELGLNNKIRAAEITFEDWKKLYTIFS